jgi:hypothetical protein
MSEWQLAATTARLDSLTKGEAVCDESVSHQPFCY